MTKKNTYIFEKHFEVRDYECDIEGIVNNAVYLNYAEYTRHCFLKSIGVSFLKLHEKGIDPVVARMKLSYKTPLRSEDEIISRLNLKKQGIRYIFHQDIFRAADEKLCFRGEIEIVTLINGKLGPSEDYDKAFAQFLPADD